MFIRLIFVYIAYKFIRYGGELSRMRLQKSQYLYGLQSFAIVYNIMLQGGDEMNASKGSKIRKALIIMGCALCAFVFVAVACNIISKVVVIPPEDIYGTPVEVMDGLSITPEAMEKVTDKEMQALIDEYGEDSNIIILDVGFGS